MRKNLFIGLNLMLIVIFPLLHSGCLEDNNKPSVAVGTHFKLMVSQNGLGMKTSHTSLTS